MPSVHKHLALFIKDLIRYFDLNDTYGSFSSCRSPGKSMSLIDDEENFPEVCLGENFKEKDSEEDHTKNNEIG